MRQTSSDFLQIFRRALDEEGFESSENFWCDLGERIVEGYEAISVQ